MNKRNESIDALRFISMIMVVALHYFGRGGLNLANNALPFNSALGVNYLYILQSGCKLFLYD